MSFICVILLIVNPVAIVRMDYSNLHIIFPAVAFFVIMATENSISFSIYPYVSFIKNSPLVASHLITDQAWHSAILFIYQELVGLTQGHKLLTVYRVHQLSPIKVLNRSDTVSLFTQLCLAWHKAARFLQFLDFVSGRPSKYGLGSIARLVMYY